MRRLTAVLTAAAVLFPGVVPGQEVKKSEPIVVTATKVETSAEKLGASVSVVTEEDLTTYNYQRPEDALRSVPGVDVQRSGSLGKTTSVRIRGANTNQTQVLVDGLRVKSPTLGQFDFSDLSLDAIGRIEIVRGPQSTLHGADAIGGIVNVISKKGAGPPTGTLFVEGGSYETFREQLVLSGAVGLFNFSASASRTDSRGHDRNFDNDDSDQTAFAGRLGFDLPWNGTFTLTGRYAKSETDLPVGFAPIPLEMDPDAQQQTEFRLYTVRYDQKLFPWWTMSLRAGTVWSNQGFQNGPNPPGDFAFTVQTNTRHSELEVLSTWEIAGIDTLTLGYENQRDQGNNRGTFRAGIETNSLFVQNELRILDRVILGGGLRWDDNDRFGDELTPRASIVVLLPETGTRLRATYGEAFRAPTLNDLFFPDFTGVCPPFGNVNLKPETSRSWEAGADQKLWQGRVRFGATYFKNSFRDLITGVVVPPFAFCVQNTNVGRARTEGLEAYAEVEPLDWLLLFTNYTFTEGENETSGDDLLRIPRHRWNGGVNVTPHPKLSLFAQAYVTSRQFDNGAGAGGAAGHNPGHYRIDVGGTLTLLERAKRLERLELTARIQNVTDNTYEEVFGFRSPGLFAMVGLRAQFR